MAAVAATMSRTAWSSPPEKPHADDEEDAAPAPPATARPSSPSVPAEMTTTEDDAGPFRGTAEDDDDLASLYPTASSEATKASHSSGSQAAKGEEGPEVDNGVASPPPKAAPLRDGDGDDDDDLEEKVAARPRPPAELDDDVDVATAARGFRRPPPK